MGFIMSLELINTIAQYKEDVIALSGNLYGEIPAKVLNVGEKQGGSLLWWKEPL